MIPIDAIKIYLKNKKLPIYKGKSELDFLYEWLDNIELKTTKDFKEYKDENDISISEIIGSCNRCSSIINRKHSFGSGKNRVMIVLNAPIMISREEIRKYKDDSIELLKRIIKTLKLKFDECYITNLIKCETSDLLLKPSQMMNECKSIFLKEIKILNPEIVIVMGEILPLQKIIRENNNIFWYNIHHPVTLLKNIELKRPAWNTLKHVINKLENLKIIQTSAAAI